MLMSHRMASVALLVAFSAAARGAGLPPDILRQIPQGYTVLSSAASTISPARRFYFVAVASERLPTRPLLIFERGATGRYSLVARNDDVILRAEDGGVNGCDPFEDRKIAVKEAYFTVEHGVACGAHWTDLVTFRFDPQQRSYVFDNWRIQSWDYNPSSDPDAEALVSDGQKVVRANGPLVRFSEWRRPSG
jgi:hypothetical protein